MFNAIRAAALTTALVAITTASIIAPMAASAAPATPSANDSAQYGVAVAASNAQRHITLTADTRYVNVDDGDTVEFQTNNGNFTWHFDTLRGASAFDLSKIAPAGSLPREVTVYVASNPLYRG